MFVVRIGRCFDIEFIMKIKYFIYYLNYEFNMWMWNCINIDMSGILYVICCFIFVIIRIDGVY